MSWQYRWRPFFFDRLSATCSCHVDLRAFPLDQQICKVSFESRESLLQSVIRTVDVIFHYCLVILLAFCSEISRVWAGIRQGRRLSVCHPCPWSNTSHSIHVNDRLNGPMWTFSSTLWRRRWDKRHSYSTVQPKKEFSSIPPKLINI